VSQPTVWLIAKQLNIKLTDGQAAQGGGISPKKRAQIITALKVNPNATAVAREVGGVSYSTVLKIAKELNIKFTLGRAAEISREKRAKIIAALKTNKNSIAVARQIGDVTQSTVWRIAKSLNIELTDGRAAQGGGMSPEKRAQIIAALQVNPNANGVAREVGGVNPHTVWRIAKKLNIKLTAGRAAQGRKMPSKNRARIIAALKLNPNASEVARQIGGVSLATVYKIAKQLGIGRRKVRRMRPEMRPQIIAALKLNPNPSEVARQVGSVGKSTVYKIAKELGIGRSRHPR
jgi:transposase-like protein